MTPQEKLAQQIQLLETLASIDASIRRFDAQIAEEQSSLDELHKELASLDSKLSIDRKSVEEMQRTLGELSTEARQMGAQIDKSREKLSRARNERENVAAEREIEELRKLLRDREQEVGKLNALVETAKRSVSDGQTQREKIHLELSSNESGISQRIHDVQREREGKIAERSEIAKKITPQTLRRYESVRKKKGSGLARVVGGTCRACHISLSPLINQRLMRRETFEECPNCHRVLYWVPEPQASEDEGAA